MIYILDTGPLVAAFRRPTDGDPFTPWAAKLIRSLPYPLFTSCRGHDLDITVPPLTVWSISRRLESDGRGADMRIRQHCPLVTGHTSFVTCNLWVH